MLKVDLPKNQSSIIKVIGVGGGGSNAVNYMYNQGISGVDFIVCNTDAKSLDISPVPNKIQLGKGLGAGNMPAVAKRAAEEKSDEIKALLEKNTQMLFITAGMGGGTGTGAAPVIAALAKEIELPDDTENKILTVAIVTLPFSFEGRKRKLQAEEGIRELKKYVDAILIITNDKLREFGDLPLGKAFEKADNILTTAAKGIAEIITVKSYVNIDFRDVNTVMKSSGVALMGTGIAEGENRAYRAIEMAINSPLLNDSNIRGAKNLLLYFSSMDKEITMDEITEVTDYILNEAGMDVDIIWGAGKDAALGDKLIITLVATGFDRTDEEMFRGISTDIKKKPFVLEPEVATETFTVAPETNSGKDINDFLLKGSSANDDIPFIIENSILNEETIADFSFKPNIPLANDEPFLMSKIEVNAPPKISESEDQQSQTSIEEKEQTRVSNERIQRLKELSMKIRTPEGLSEIEKQPAYIRRNMPLSDITPSSESEMSRYTLSDNGENSPEIKQNNKFLHDNVD